MYNKKTEWSIFFSKQGVQRYVQARIVMSPQKLDFEPWEQNDYMSHITRKLVFEDFRPGKIQTSLLSYRN